jgi:hypothetical protein
MRRDGLGRGRLPLPGRSGRRAAVRASARGIRDARGVSVVEVLISVVVLAIIVVPVFNSLVAGRVLTSHRGEKRMALRLMERKIEQLMQPGYASGGADDDISSLNLDPGTHPIDPSIVVSTRSFVDISDDLVGELTWTVTPVAWSSPGDSVRAKMTEVKLRWPSDNPRDSLTLTTLIGS